MKKYKQQSAQLLNTEWVLQAGYVAPSGVSPQLAELESVIGRQTAAELAVVKYRIEALVTNAPMDTEGPRKGHTYDAWGRLVPR